MRYPVHSIKLEDLLTEIPLLNDIFEETMMSYNDRDWMRFITAEQLMAYMVYVYHRKSPLADRIADIITRKKTALELVGIDLRAMDNNQLAKPIFSSIVLSHHEFANHLALNFLKFENNLKWMQLVRAMEAWEDALFQMQQESEGTKNKSAVDIAAVKTKLYQGAKQYQDDINRLSNELMQEDMALQNAMASHLFVEKRRRRLITPEDYASLSPEEREEEFRSRGLLN